MPLAEAERSPERKPVAHRKPFRSQLEPIDCIEPLVTTIGGIDEEIVVLTCIDHDGYVGEAEVIVKRGGDKMQIPLDVLFRFAESRGAAEMVASKSSGPIDCLHERDIRFTDALRAYGGEIGIPLHEHVVIEKDMFRLMSESMGWNETGEP
jgi:RadC-like JAB domain-containing protein